ncbi:MAG: primosomal protein N' [Firmicutes bacterium]|nr:primosomal protein N' [Bacillota bacterium]
MFKKEFVEVIVDNRSTKTDRIYTYKIPDSKKDILKEGMRVLVPFGFGNKLLEGIVIGFKEEIDIDINKVKGIKKIVDQEPVLSKNMINLGMWMKYKYLAQFIDVFRTMLPTGISNKVNKYISLNKIDKINLDSINSENQKKIVKYLLNNGESEFNTIRKNLNLNNINSSMKSLKKKGIIKTKRRVDNKIDKRYERFVKLLTSNNEEININKRAYKQIEILKYLKKNNNIKLNKLLSITNSNLQSAKSLESKGIIKIYEKEVKRNPVTKEIKKSYKYKLQYEQQKCFDIINSDIQNKRHNKFLLHGVTGSGKTEIYLQLIEKMLNLKKQSIVLVPEISLTPQTLDRFIGRFGDDVAVLHSRLSLGERYDEWRKIKEGEVNIVVGARSAIFAPFKNLGLIVIDEEHESSYKSSMSPKYDTIEVAKKRCELEDASLLLGSATPSINTYYEALKNDIKLLELNNRVNDKNMPEVDVIDMKEELKSGNKSIFSEKLYEAIKDNLKIGKQTILFLNRRGFSTFISCRECGHVLKCRECDISLTYHRNKNSLICHYCGLAVKPPNVCPECGSKYIKYFGIGTQRVEEMVKEAFDTAKVLRMDVDTTSKKGSHERILNKFKEGNADILIGTQMISKGLDFPNVTLVGVIAADISLNLPDYRSSERTFQLITQVAGRAGRGDNEGKVIVQTYEPDHFSIQMAKNHNYKEFYKNEILLREEFEYPPFINLINIVISGIKEHNVIKTSKETYREIINNIDKIKMQFNKDDIMGPNPAPIMKIKGKYRWQILIKCDNGNISILKDIIYSICVENNENKKSIKFNLDINPISII